MGYSIAMGILYSSVLTATFYFPIINPSIWDHLNNLIGLIVTILGVVLLYWANQGERGQDFAARYLSISLVVFVRMIVVLIPIALIFGIVAGFLEVAMDPQMAMDAEVAEMSAKEEGELASTVWDFIVINLIYVFYYGLAYHHMVSTNKAAQSD